MNGRALLRGRAFLLFALASCVSSALAACDGHTAAFAPAGAPAAKGATTRFVIEIPKRSSRARHSKYVSPATLSMTVAVDQAGVAAPGFPQTIDLTPSSQGCSSTLAGTECTLAVTLAPGIYTASIDTYDRVGGAGNELSQAQGVVFQVSAAHANQVSLTLDGIPAGIAVAGASPAVHGSQAAGFTIYGSSAQPLLVTAIDADGNTIVGAGAPSYTASVVAGTWSAPPAPASSAPNTLRVTPPGTNGSGAVLNVTASFDDGGYTCGLAAARCSATVSVKNDIQTLFVANYDRGLGSGSVAVYASPYTGSPIVNNSETYAYSLAIDAAGSVVVGTGAGPNQIGLLTAPSYAQAFSFSSGLNTPRALLFDPSGNLFVANDFSTGSVVEYAPTLSGSSAPVATITNGIDLPNALLMDGSGNLFVSNANTVTEYSAPFAGAPAATLSAGVSTPTALAMNAAGDLFVANYAAETVTEYAPPFSNGSTPIATLSTGGANPTALALDGAGNLFVARAAPGEGSVAEYAPPYTGTPLTVSNGIDTPSALAIDGMGNLFVANAPTASMSDGSVTEYTPPYTGSPTTITLGVNNPEALVFTP
jgi:hypothetical protein